MNSPRAFALLLALAAPRLAAAQGPAAAPQPAAPTAAAQPAPAPTPPAEPNRVEQLAGPTMAAPVATLSLSEALGRARANAPAVLAAIAQARAQLAQLAVARAALLPTVTGNASAGLSANGLVSLGSASGATNVGAGGSALFSAFTLSAGVSARWTIWDFGRTNRTVEALQAGQRSALANARNAERSAQQAVASAWFNVQADRELATAQREILAQRERQLSFSEGLVRAGARPNVEQVRAAVSRDSARLDLLQTEWQFAQDIASLVAALGMDPALVVELTPATLPAQDDDPGRAAAEAERTRPEVQQAQAQLAQVEAQLAQARAGFLPTLSATAGGTVQYSNRFDGTPGAAGPTANVGVQLSVPIFDPTVVANVRAAEAALPPARALLEQARLSVRSDAVQAALNVRAAVQALAQAERLAEGTAANLAAVEGRYAAGAANLLELVDAQSQDSTARVTMVRSRQALMLARVQLLAATHHYESLGGGAR